MAGCCLTLGKESREKQKESYVGEWSWETCQYERKDAFSISTMVANHLKWGKATSKSRFTVQLKKGGRGSSDNTWPLCLACVSPAAGQLHSFLSTIEPPSASAFVFSFCLALHRSLLFWPQNDSIGTSHIGLHLTFWVSSACSDLPPSRLLLALP